MSEPPPSGSSSTPSSSAGLPFTQSPSDGSPTTDSSLADKARLGSFTDNVVSIAITLLVLDVRLPPDFSNLTVVGILSAVWPRLLAFVLSFAIVGVYWVGHHLMLKALTVAPRSLLWVNNLFLLFISLIPASAALLGGHPNRPATAVLYGLNVACVGASMLLFWRVSDRFHRSRGLQIDPVTMQLAYSRTFRGIGFALTGVALAAVSPWLSYAVFWISPISYVIVQLKPMNSDRTTGAG